ncbi:unnamed protein product, partial [marine sediment metagenome]
VSKKEFNDLKNLTYDFQNRFKEQLELLNEKFADMSAKAETIRETELEEIKEEKPKDYKKFGA